MTSAQLLDQAVRSRDAELMGFVLNRTEEGDIPDLAGSLAAASLAAFLNAFTQHVVRCPDALEGALPWLEAVVRAHGSGLAASAECRHALAELQRTLRQRAQGMAMFAEAGALSDLVRRERDGTGIGLEVVDVFCQDLSEG